MAAAPIVDLLQIFYRHADEVSSVQPPVKEVLFRLLELHPSLKKSAVYLHSQDKLVYYASTDTESSPPVFSLDEYSQYDEVIYQKEVYRAQNADTLELCLPLETMNEVLGIIQLEFEADSAPDTAYWMSLARQFTLAMENRHLNNVMQLQLNTLTALKSCTSFRDVASILARHTISPGQFVSINYFEHNANNQQGIRVIATANRNLAYEPDEFHAVDVGALRRYRSTLEAEQDYLIGDISKDLLLPPETRDWLQAQDIRSGYHLLLQSSGITYGFIAYNDTQKDIVLSVAERRAYRSIADEVAVILENQNLQQQRESALQESRTLYQISDSLMYARDIPGLLRNLKNGPGRDADRIYLLDMGYDDDNHLKSIVIRYIAEGTTIENPDRAVHHDLDEETLQTIQKMWTKQRQTLEMVEDTSLLDEQPAMLQQIFDSPKIGSAITIPIFENGRREQQLSFTWEAPNSIDGRLLNLLQAIQAQIIVVLKNQQYRMTIEEAVAESRQQVQILQHLNQFSQEVQAELQVERIMERILQRSPDILPFDYLSVQMYHPELGLREILWYRDGKEHIQIPGKQILPEDSPIIQKVWADKTSQHVQDLQADTLEHPGAEGIRSLIVSPIITGGILRGIFEAGNLKPHTYSTVQVAALQQMSGQIGIALANAETVARSQKVARNKALASEIGTRLQQQPDLERMAGITIQQLRRIPGAKRARIRLGGDVPLHDDKANGETEA